MSTRKFMGCALIVGVLLCYVSLAFGKGLFSFEILSDKKVNGLKRSVEIRLDRRITYQQLETLAHKIKALDTNRYDRTFMLYYLPHQRVGAGAWASTHFTPNLKVEMLGATVDDVKKFRAYSIKNGWAAPQPPKKSPQIWGAAEQKDNLQYGGEIIGEWIWDLPDLSHKITVFKKSGKFFINNYHRDGSQDTVQLKSSKIPRGLELKEVKSNTFREYYIINKKGELEFYDMDYDLKRGNILVLPPEKI